MVTPFTKDGDLIEDGFKEIIDYTISKGATGVVPAGTTGEFVYMRTEERKKLLRLTVEHVDGRGKAKRDIGPGRAYDFPEGRRLFVFDLLRRTGAFAHHEEDQ